MKCTKEITNSFVRAILSNKEVDILAICQSLAVPIEDYFYWTKDNKKFRETVKEAIDFRKSMQQHELYFAEVNVKHKMVELLMTHLKTDKFEEKTLLVKEVFVKDEYGKIKKDKNGIPLKEMRPVMQKAVVKKVKQDWLLKLGLPQIFPDVFQAPKAKTATVLPTLFEDYETEQPQENLQNLMNKIAAGVPKTVTLNGVKKQVGWDIEPNPQLLAWAVKEEQIVTPETSDEYEITMNLGGQLKKIEPIKTEDPQST